MLLSLGRSLSQTNHWLLYLPTIDLYLLFLKSLSVQYHGIIFFYVTSMTKSLAILQACKKIKPHYNGLINVNNYVKINSRRRKVSSEGLPVFTRMTRNKLENLGGAEHYRKPTSSSKREDSALVIENYIEEWKAKQCLCLGLRSLKQLGRKL